ncbi:unnamed protein product, partial [marine sediment metagenome]
IERIPTEYALRWPFGVFMSLPVKILHGREPNFSLWPNAPQISDVREIVNAHTDMRIWSPRDVNWKEGVIPEAGWMSRE